MAPSAAALTGDLVLVGGGHTHALVLRALAMRPPPGLRITLISPDAFTPYSGMLPGLLAGHYSFEETHIDLARLCQWAGVRFLADEVVALDRESRRLHCRHRGAVSYDLLSLDIGSQPELDSVPGARRHSVPVKPVAGLWARWQALLEEAVVPRQLAVVGGGAGSVEIALAVAHRFREQRPRIDLYCGGPELLEGYAGHTRRAVLAHCATLGVTVHCDHRVVRVEAQELHFASGRRAGYDSLFWCTGAAAAPWVAQSGLPVDERGFMTVADSLLSTGDERVFGCGDIAVQVANPRPRAGVYAVRQAPALAANLAARARGEALRLHRPQRRFLSILSLGDQRAVAQRGWLRASGAWVWRWKDRIDRAFMRRFEELPPRSMQSAAAGEGAVGAQAPCGGCGAKVGGASLAEVLAQLRSRYPAHAPEPALDDVALVDAGQPLLQSTDQLRALLDDPWLMGRIAAQHALSDIYACAARPLSALAQVTLPFAAPALAQRDLFAVLDGALTIFADADCRLLGGHSMQGPELQVGFTVNGVADGQAALGKRGCGEGDVLLLGKALGTGVLFAAHMQQCADGRHIEAALASMQQSNAAAAAIARRCGARALTDVTGFGLAGHLLEMLGGEGSARIEVEALPVLPGALALLKTGVTSTLHDANRNYVAAQLPPAAALRGRSARTQLLFDPQTSGGLLMAVPPEQAAPALQALKDSGYAAARIGQVLGKSAPGGSRLVIE